MFKAVIAAALAAGAGSALGSVSVEAFSNATVNHNGVRSQDFFFNAQGSANGAFESYAVATFDGAAIVAALDLQYGVGQWNIDTISLNLTQSNAAFTADGAIGIGWTNNDDLSLQTPGALTPTFTDVLANYGDAQSLAFGTFVEVATGLVDTFGLYDFGGTNLAGANDLLADLLAGNSISIIIRAIDASTAATWAGYTNNTYAGPTLTVTVPAPGALALIGLGGLAAARRRR